MTRLVLSTGDASTPFEVTNEVKQGCVLTPVLFNLFFIWVLTHALHDFERGVYLRYRLDGSLFDLRRLNAKTKTLERLILDALLANDCVLMAHSEPDLRTIIDRFVEVTQLFGLTIILDQTKVLYQPAPGTTAPPSKVSVAGIELKAVDHARYLGSVISSDASLDKEIAGRKVSQSLGRLCSGCQRSTTKTASSKTWSTRALLRQRWNGAPTTELAGCSNQRGLQEVWRVPPRKDHCRQTPQEGLCISASTSLLPVLPLSPSVCVLNARFHSPGRFRHTAFYGQ